MPRYVEYEATRPVTITHLPGAPTLAKGDRLLVFAAYRVTLDAFYCGALLPRGEVHCQHALQQGTWQRQHVVAGHQHARSVDGNPADVVGGQPDPVALPSDPPAEEKQPEETTKPKRGRNRSMADKANRKVK